MPSDALAGQTLGKYLVMEPLGRGGMARVYRAYHAALDRQVAVKVLRTDLLEENDLLLRLQREARAIGGLRHPNIVQVFDFDQQDDLYYLVMELLDGESLRGRLNDCRLSGTRLPLIEAVRIIQDVLSGLSYAHAKGVIHRDIKPANIMLTKQGQAVITDFGIAQLADNAQLTRSGTVVGTLSYMAPEQGLQGRADARSDIYSLGIVMYEMLTGSPPFDADTPLAILMKHQNEPLPEARKLDPEIPPALENVMVKALAKDPQDRWQSADEMSAALNDPAFGGLANAERKSLNGSPQRLVYSGSSLEAVADAGFSRLDTDPDLELTAGKAAGGSKGAAASRRAQAAGAVLGGLAVVLAANFLALMAGSLTGRSIFALGWPLELFLVSAFLSILMTGLETHWLLIPILLIFDNTCLLAYTSLSGRWTDWSFLWLLSAILTGAAISIPILYRRVLKNRMRLVKQFGAALGLVSVLLAVWTGVLALQAGMK